MASKQNFTLGLAALLIILTAISAFSGSIAGNAIKWGTKKLAQPQTLTKIKTQNNLSMVRGMEDKEMVDPFENTVNKDVVMLTIDGVISPPPDSLPVY